MLFAPTIQLLLIETLCCTVAPMPIAENSLTITLPPLTAFGAMLTKFDILLSWSIEEFVLKIQ